MCQALKTLFTEFNIDPHYVDIYRSKNDCIFLGADKVKEIVATLNIPKVTKWPSPTNININNETIQVLFTESHTVENRVDIIYRMLRFKCGAIIICIKSREALNPYLADIDRPY